MAKTKYVCSSCGYESGKWYGRCPECSNWNTFEEVTVPDTPKKGRFGSVNPSQLLTPQKISSVKLISESRVSTGFEEFDRVLGTSGFSEKSSAGIVAGSIILLSGDPGIGKSTILLQLALGLSDAVHKKTVLYITGEESEHQIKMRATRIVGDEELGNSNLLILSTTDIDMAAEVMIATKPDLVIVDSVQTLATSQLPGFAGSVPQIRYVTTRVVSFAKTNNIPVFLVGHVTKEGIVAGPMLLSHMVDTVLYLEGDQLTGTRILRAYKNRFGDTSEVGIFVMEEKGLTQIQDVEGFFMNKQDEKVPGSCVAVVMEGSRPLLVELQALVVPSTLSFPRRVSTGLADRRLELLLAVIQKYAKVPVERMDVFVNIVGGLKISETAADLAAAVSIISSFYNKPLPHRAAIGEIGLLGELKIVPNLDKRIREAEKFGFQNVLSAKSGKFLYNVVQNMYGKKS